MKIKSLKLINFKSFAEGTLFNFQESNSITGANGTGKSTLKDAIVFCLYNRTSDGSATESDKYINTGKMKCLVEVTLEIDGKEHVIRRERTAKQTRITYMDKSQSEEDSVITQRELDSIIPNYEDFQSVFNIGYFMKQNDKDKREYILSLTPHVDKSEIYYKLGGKDEWLGGLDFNNIEETHKNLLKEKRENEEELIRIDSIIRDSDPIEIPVNPYQDLSEEISRIRELHEQATRNEMLWQTYNLRLKENEEIEENNKAIVRQLEDIVIKNLDRPDYGQLNNLIKQKNAIQSLLELPKGKCPTCLQTISATHKNKVDAINDKNRHLAESLGRKIQAEQSRVDGLEKEYQQNENNKNDAEIMRAKIRTPLKLEVPPEKIAVDTVKLEQLESQQKLYDEVQTRIKLLTQQEAERVAKIERLRKNRSSIYDDKDKLTMLISIFSPKGIPFEEMEMKLKPIIEKFNQFIPEARIQTLEVLKNGLSFKEVFKIHSGDKEYSKMSLGEKTRVDIALSQIINSFLKTPIDCYFLDNSEILDKKPELPIQNFICQVLNKPLTIN